MSQSKLLSICAKEAENLNIILSCDGASNVGQIAHQIAVELTNGDLGRMRCITAVGAESKPHLDIMRRAKKIIVINGCQINVQRESSIN
ncbi:MAG: putative zinc-binding protein [Nitrososphaerales archaeon]